MPDQLNSYSDVDDVIANYTNTPLFHFVPEDTAVFRADDIGDWQSGYILASTNPDFGLWNIHHSPRINDPERFDRTRAVWVDQEYIVDWFIEQRLLEGPTDTINRPLTEMNAE